MCAVRCSNQDAQVRVLRLGHDGSGEVSFRVTGSYQWPPLLGGGASLLCCMRRMVALEMLVT